jgi:hypothetical protein
MNRFSITLAAAVLAALSAPAYADTVKSPPECAAAKDATACADILQKLGKNPFDAWPVVRTYAYVDASGNPLVGITSCNVTDQGQGVTDVIVACHTERVGWTCKRSIFDDPAHYKYVCAPWLDKAGLPTDDPFADMVLTPPARATSAGIDTTPPSPGKQTDDPFANFVPPSPEARAANLAADHQKAMLECTNKPTWLGVLLCRWDVGK